MFRSNLTVFLNLNPLPVENTQKTAIFDTAFCVWFTVGILIVSGVVRQAHSMQAEVDTLLLWVVAEILTAAALYLQGLVTAHISDTCTFKVRGQEENVRV